MLAFKILSRIERDKAYSNIVLDSELKNNSTAYAPFVSSLVYGVVERKITLDYILSCYLSQPLKKLKPQVLTILRMGAYQLKFMDKIPDSAAVNESVKLSKKCGCAYASGLINSVLRKIAVNDIVYYDTKDKEYLFSVQYSCPRPLVKRYINDYGSDIAEGILSDSLNAPPVTVRANTLRISVEDLQKNLLQDGVLSDLSNNLPSALILHNAGDISGSKCYKKGLFHVQDLASQMCIEALDPQPGETVFDMCSSPGGKAFTIAEKMNNQGKIYAFDIYDHRTELIKSGAERLGISIINTAVSDASVYNNSLPMADRILCDVPCSGLGVIRRKPEIKYRDLDFIDKLNDLQYNIINCAAKYLKNGGILVYSTCSLSKAENQDICDKFILNNPNFSKVPFGGSDGYRTLFPHIDGTDGFFIAKFVKG